LFMMTQLVILGSQMLTDINRDRNREYESVW